MVDRAERIIYGTPDASRRRCSIHEFRVLRFEVEKLAVHRVVGVVIDDRCIEHVVAMIVLSQLGEQLAISLFCGHGTSWRHHATALM
jgi:hypothetical protein